MEKGTEMFEEWIKLQKDFMENWVKGQKDFMEQWTEATTKFQKSFADMGKAQEGPAKDMFDQYNAWLNTMISSSKVLTDEAVKIQGAWVSSVEKQMEMYKNFSKLFTPPTAAK
ncbi:MAG: hypothetical protein OEV28_07030 [Nitrospirota bacterium]|nr:hypothetical protein [Nitrospirota bacterium]